MLLVCQILRREPVSWAQISEPEALSAFETAEREGVHLLMAHHLRRDGGLERFPAAVRARLDASLRDELAIDQISRRELQRVIEALDAAGIGALIFKGAALAFTHYDDPVLRPRVDADLIVKSDDAPMALDVLERIGYRPSSGVPSSQLQHTRTDSYGIKHVIDLHWKASVPQVFAQALPYEELIEGALPIHRLGPYGRTVGSVHALAIACIHRVAHHHDRDRLIWFYDIHLLASALGTAEVEAFLRFAERKRIAAVCAAGISLARQTFRTELPGGLLEGLFDAVARNGREPSAVFLSEKLRMIDVLLSDLAALESWGERRRLLRERVLPPPRYMQEAYGVSSRALLPLLYAWRCIEAAPAWFRKGSAAGES